MATTLPTISTSTMVSAFNSFSPGTSRAFALLSTMRLRMAFRSPGAGDRPVLTNGFFLILSDLPAPLALRLRWLGGALAFGFILTTADWIEVVEKAESRGAGDRPEAPAETEGRKRHFQQFEDAIA